jgi:hypothetical protein
MNDSEKYDCSYCPDDCLLEGACGKSNAVAIRLATAEARIEQYKRDLGRLVEAERLLSDLYWHDWTAAREAEVRLFLGLMDDGPRR